MSLANPIPEDDDRDQASGEEAISLDAHARANELLGAAAAGAVDIFDSADAARLALDKEASDLLVKLRLAAFADAGRTQLALTNAGRYWALHGGYMAFLREPPTDGQGGGGGRQRNPELEALRFDYMRLRLNTFWWTFGLSIASFVISLVTLSVAYFYGGALFK